MAAADGAMGTFWGDLIGPNPTDRGKAVPSALLDGPLALWLREQTARCHDDDERPQPTEEEPQHLCLDKG